MNKPLCALGLGLGLWGGALAQSTFAPDPQPFYLGASYYGVNVAGAASQLRLMLGHDALVRAPVGSLGLRLTADLSLGRVANPGHSVSGTATYTYRFAPAALYLGAGGGYNLSRNRAFGEGLIGLDYPVIQHLDLFGEVREQLYPDGQTRGIGSLVAGLKLRF